MLWENLKEKLNKFKRKWNDIGHYRNAELFCENCGESLGIHDIVSTNLETLKYCSKCVKSYIKETPYTIQKGIDIIKDMGDVVVVRYYDDDPNINVRDEHKVCYFNKQGRAIKIKGKKYYL